ncbi:hypothetical protein ACRALDRAFT_2060884 [Sodiomyces alcalophilus JCM 7366]|uniref:uncharacterized protein n=1 Tax=Sodiomyces alcalophilus JCM 7366 TaxID=591952 RepID=UPI0039B6B005
MIYPGDPKEDKEKESHLAPIDAPAESLVPELDDSIKVKSEGSPCRRKRVSSTP